MDDYGISIDCPSEALATGEIPVRVEMRGNERTEWDTDGNPDKALTVALLRRDRPGLRFLAKIDPRLIMLPDEPLAGRPSDEELDASTVMIVEKLTLDAASPEGCARGAADYFVTGAFSLWWSGVRELRVSDPAKRISPPSVVQPRPDGGAWKARPVATADDLSIRLEAVGDQDCLVVPVRPGLFAGPDWAPRGEAQPWLTLVGFKLCTRGGACGDSFAIEVEQGELGGEVLIPVAALALEPIEGDWLFLGVVGGELLPPVEIHVRKKDER